MLLYIIIIIIYSSEFFTSALADGLSLEFEWQQVSLRLQDSSQYSSHSPFSNPFVTIPNAPISIGEIVTCMFHSFFFNSLARFRYLSFFSRYFSFILWSAGTAKSTIYYYYYFHTSVTWLFFHGVCQTANLLRSSRVLSVF